MSVRWAWVGCLLVAALSLIAPSAPTTDSWGWIVWGREVVHLHLSTVVPGAPSWKPGPVLITAPLALAGGIAPTLWLLVARAGALGSLVVSARFATRLAGPWAGALAAAGLVFTAGWVREFSHAYTEPLAIGLLVLAVEQQLAGRLRWAVVLSALVALIRPEALALTAVYGVLAWRRREASPAFAGAVGAAVIALWVIPDWLGSGQWLHASKVASLVVPSGPAATRAALREGAAIVLWPISLGALAAGVLAWRRRERAVLWLIGIAAGWSALLTLMFARGYPAEPRFFALPAGLWCIAGAVGLVWLARAPRAAPLRVATAGAIALLLVPFAVARGHHSADEAIDAVDRAQLEAQLRTVIARAGPTRQPMLPGSLGWMKGEVAWQLDLPLRDVLKARTSDLAYLEHLDEPDADPVPRLDAVSVAHLTRGELLLVPFGNSHLQVAHRSHADLDTVARSGRWRAVVLERRIS